MGLGSLTISPVRLSKAKMAKELERETMETTETKHKNITTLSAKLRIWEFLELHDETRFQDLAELGSLSMKFDFEDGPYLAFLDLIGYSQDNYGSTMYRWDTNRMGYLELNYVADALKLYTIDPSGVLDWITELNELDQ